MSNLETGGDARHQPTHDRTTELVSYTGVVGVELVAAPERVGGRLACSLKRCTTGGVLHGTLLALTATMGDACALEELHATRQRVRYRRTRLHALSHGV